MTKAHNLLHGGETVVWGDTGYQGVDKREENLLFGLGNLLTAEGKIVA